MPLPIDTTETITLLAGLIESELGFNPNDHRVMIYNQKWRIPDKDWMFVVVAYLGTKTFGSKLKYVNDPTDESQQTLSQVQSVNVQELYSIKCFSRDSEARIRNHEIIWALNSTAAQTLCEQNAFRIASLPSSLTDVSEVEASARLNRYDLTVNVLRAYGRTTPVPSYDNFSIPPQVLINP